MKNVYNKKEMDLHTHGIQSNTSVNSTNYSNIKEETLEIPVIDKATNASDQSNQILKEEFEEINTLQEPLEYSTMLERDKSGSYFRKIGNTYCLLFLNKDRPIIVIGPNYLYTTVVYALTIITKLVFDIFIFPPLDDSVSIIGTVIFYVLMTTYTLTVIINPGLCLKSDKSILKKYKRQRLQHSSNINLIESDTSYSDIQQTEDNLNNETHEEKESNKILEIKNFKKLAKENVLYYCHTCNIVKSKSKTILHCFYCDVCVSEYDHHCPWTGKCIGEYNVFSFWLFIFSMFCYIMFLVISVTLLFVYYIELYSKKSRKL